MSATALAGDKPAPLPAKVEPLPVVRGISFAEPILDRVTNLGWWEKSLYVTVAGRAGAIYRLDVKVRGAR